MEEEKKQFALHGRRKVTKEAFLREMGISEQDIRSPDSIEAEQRAKRVRESIPDQRRRNSVSDEPNYTSAVSGFSSDTQTSKADLLKEDGNTAFQNCNFDQAATLFTEAIAADPNNHILYSNRCASYLIMGSEYYNCALFDAEQCVTLNPTWFKGYVRKGDTLLKLRRSEEAMQSFTDALELYPGSKSIKKAIHECKKIIKAERRQRNNPKLQSMLEDFQNEYGNNVPLEANTYMASELAAFRNQSTGCNTSSTDSDYNLSSVQSTASTSFGSNCSPHQLADADISQF